MNINIKQIFNISSSETIGPRRRVAIASQQLFAGPESGLE